MTRNRSLRALAARFTLVAACSGAGVTMVGCASAPVPTDTPAAHTPLVVSSLDGIAHNLDRVLASGEVVALVFWQSW